MYLLINNVNFGYNVLNFNFHNNIRTLTRSSLDTSPADINTVEEH